MTVRKLLLRLGLASRTDRVAFEHSLVRDSRPAMLFGSGLILVLFPLWGLVDAVLEPAHAEVFIRLRLWLLVPVAATAWWLWGADATRERFHALSGLMMLVPAAAIAWMVARVEHYEAYTIGYSLLLWGAGTLLVLPLRWVAGLIFALLALVATALSLHPRPLVEMLVIAAYLSSAAAISFVISVVVHRLRYRQFRAITSLQQERAHVAELMLRLEKLSVEDDLTGLANRRRWRLAFEDPLQLARVTAIAIIDLDHFKQINDRYGHDAGDRVLAELGRVARDSLTAHALIARLGGDELGVMGFRVGLDGQLETLRVRVASLQWHDFPGLGLTLSIGIAERAAGEDARSLLVRADRALYRAKQVRNTVRVARAGEQ